MLWFNSSLGLQLYMILNESETQEGINQNNVHSKCNSLVFHDCNHGLFFRYFNYRTTKFLAEEGFYKFHNWFDDRAWYPLGRIIGGTIYPGKNRRSIAV